MRSTGSRPTRVSRFSRPRSRTPQQQPAERRPWPGRRPARAIPPATTQGSNTIQGDNTLTSQMVTDFAAALKKYARRQDRHQRQQPVLHPRTSGAERALRSAPATGAARRCWGSTTKPKIVYINGTLDNANTQYTSLDIAGNSEGTGILIIENGNTDVNGNFRWNGPVITTGRNVGIRYRGGGYQSVYGATVVSEAPQRRPGEPGGRYPRQRQPALQQRGAGPGAKPPQSPAGNDHQLD